MSSFLEKKIQGSAPWARAGSLGDKLAVNRCREERAGEPRIPIVDDDPVMHGRRRGTRGLPCGGSRRSCAEAGRRGC